MPTTVNKIQTSADVSFQAAPIQGQVLQFDVASGNKWVNRAGSLTPTAKTAAYTAASGDHVLVDATSAAVTVTLPAAATVGSGATVRVTKTDATVNAVTVKPASGNLNGLTVAGTLTNTASKTANYTAVSLDNVLCNAAGGLFTVTLPAATAGRWVRVTKTDSSVNAVLVAPPSGTIDGDTTASVNRQNLGQNFFADGTAWHYLPDTTASTVKQLDSQDFVSDGTNWWTV